MDFNAVNVLCNVVSIYVSLACEADFYAQDVLWNIVAVYLQPKLLPYGVDADRVLEEVVLYYAWVIAASAPD